MRGEGTGRPARVAYPRPMAKDGGTRRKAAARRSTPGTTGRVTPKGTSPRGQAPRDRVPPASGRYTPPVPHHKKVSPRWVPVLMFALLTVGVLVIILNYLGVLPGDSDN